MSSGFGGKADALMRLREAGFDVPAFFALAPGEDIDPARLAALGPGPYAVRSSGVDEDGASHSHAGQYLSLLNVPAVDVPEATAQVRASAATASLAAYRDAQGLEKSCAKIAVIVQRMVPARAAGVLFTADPVSGLRDRLIVSATAGLADRLVSGETDGEGYVLDRLGSKIEGESGLLSEADLTALRALGLRIETHLGAPQDIEWAFEGDALRVLQARPITTALRPMPIEDQHLGVFDNSNVVESYPGVVSALTYSFAQHVYARVYRRFVALLGVSPAMISLHSDVFDNMLSRRDARVYYNLVNWYRALALLPGFSLNRAHMETMMGVGAPLPDDVSARIGPRSASGISRLREWGRLVWVGCGLCWQALRLGRTKRNFQRRLDAALSKPAATLETMPLTELAREYRRIEASLLDRWDAPLINDFLCMIGFGATRKILERWAGERGLALHNDIMIGQGDIVSAEPARRIREMGALIPDDAMRGALAAGDGSSLPDAPQLAAAVEAYLARFADRCTEELKLESVTLDRDPSPLYRAIATAPLTIRAIERPDPDPGACLEGPLCRWAARRALRWTKARVRDRENLRFERTRVFGRARRLFRAIGTQFFAHSLLDDPEDIFHLTVQEVLGAIEGFSPGDDLQALARTRRTAYEAARERPDPAERVTLRGASILGMAAKQTPVQTDEGSVRQGTGCSAGTVTARARVIADPRGAALERGDILVARHTDPGWIAIFASASAIVVERGSLLSHSAIVARELGIPCVVGLQDATRWVEDGERITVDGASGRVERLT